MSRTRVRKSRPDRMLLASFVWVYLCCILELRAHLVGCELPDAPDQVHPDRVPGVAHPDAGSEPPVLGDRLLQDFRVRRLDVAFEVLDRVVLVDDLEDVDFRAFDFFARFAVEDRLEDRSGDHRASSMRRPCSAFG